jgi:hypothetical protein
MNKKLLSILFLLGFVLVTYSISNVALAASDESKNPIFQDNTPPEEYPPGLEIAGMTRIISSTTSTQEISEIKQKGCSVIHKLNHATSFFCPSGIVDTLDNVRPVKIYHPHDLNADIQIGADQVWNSNPGFDGTGVIVAILDTGVQVTHDELESDIITTRDFTNDIYPNGDWKDFHGHGTHVSGIVKGQGILDVNKGTGVAPGAKIIVGKVCGFFNCLEDDIIDGIEWAELQGANVINMSLGGGLDDRIDCDTDPNPLNPPDPIVVAVNIAASKGVVVVISSGNDGNKNAVSYPGCASGAIAVGAVDNLDNVASFSNAGLALDIVAPGVNIWSSWSCHEGYLQTCNTSDFRQASGTSMSSPHVAGVVALMLDANPALTVEEVKNALYSTATDVGSFDGNGRVNALAAVNSALGSPPPPTNNPPTVNDQAFSVDENSSNGTVVGTVVATDPDAGDALTYSITGGTGQTAFDINSSTGQITVLDEPQLDFETTSSFDLTVEVEDTGLLTDAAIITINLNDVNEETWQSIEIDFPADGSLVSGKITITATVTGPYGAVVNFFVNDSPIGTDNDGAPYEMVYHTKGMQDTGNKIRVVISQTINDPVPIEDTHIVDKEAKGGGGGEKPCNPNKPGCS